MKQQLLTRAALLLALTLIFQSLRLILPIPVLASTFLVGSLVNACLMIAAETAGIWPALVIACIAPVVAYFQQLLPIPVLIGPVAAGNAILVVLYVYVLRWGRWQSILMAATAKTSLLFLSISWMLTWLAIPPKVGAALLFAMGWPQFVTAVIGGVVAGIVAKRIKAFL